MKIFQGILNYYRTWPLGRQMLVLFVVCGSLICLVLIVVTKTQLDWLRDKVVQSSETTINNRLMYQMRALAKIQAEYVSSELSCFVASASELNHLDSVINGLYYEGLNPFPTSEAYNSKVSSTKINYSRGAYYSRNELSTAGDSQTLVESSLNDFYPLMYQTSIPNIFQGYETDEILYFYPEVQKKTDYTPLSAEWYYKATNTSNEFWITEPYAGEISGSWIAAFSKALIKNSDLIGVTALNGSFDHILPQFVESRFLDTGFSLLIGKQGVILNLPETWDFISSKTYTRIFDRDVTGISSDLWDQIEKSEDGSLHYFTDATGVEFKAIKHAVVSDYLDLTHYVLACIQKERLKEYADETNERFSEVYVNLFWVILACGLFIFGASSLLIYYVSRSHSIQLNLIRGVFQNIIQKAILEKVSLTTERNFLKDMDDEFNTLYDACRIKLNKLVEIEDAFVSHAWDYKKPGDAYLYFSWEFERYPFNYYSGKSMNWKSSLDRLLVLNK